MNVASGETATSFGRTAQWPEFRVLLVAAKGSSRLLFAGAARVGRVCCGCVWAACVAGAVSKRVRTRGAGAGCCHKWQAPGREDVITHREFRG